MWRDQTRKRNFWAAIETDFDHFVNTLRDMEEEEEADLYRFDLYLRDKHDLAVFNSRERNEFLRLMSRLVSDTRRHSRTIQRVVKVLERIKKTYKEK